MLIQRIAALAAAVTIVGLAAATTPAATPKAPAAVVIGATHALVYQPAGKPRGRIILLHGYASSAQLTWTAAPYLQMVDGFVAEGWQVVAPDLPDTVPGAPDSRSAIMADLYDGSQGADYIAKWQSEFVSVRGWADRRYGKLPVYVGGVSWGGFHALYAACHNQVDGWFTLLPVTDPMLMDEYIRMSPGLTHMTLNGCAQKLAQKPGLIVFGLADMRVNGPATQTFARSIIAYKKRKLTVHVYPNLQHEGTPENVGDVVAWARTQHPK